MRKYYQIALNEEGVKEIAGAKHNSRILEYHKACDLKATTDEVAWCSSFVNWVMLTSGLPRTNKANARSWLTYGQDVTKKPEVGDICVFWRGKKNSWTGHVGFFAGESDTHILVFGGNQNNKVCFQKYPRVQLLSIRRPIDF